METQKHSGLGIASFALSLFSSCLTFLIVVLAGLLESRPGGMGEGASAVVGLSVLFAMFLCFLSIVLGIGGLAQSNRNKLFAALGVAISVMTVVGTGALMILGTVS